MTPIGRIVLFSWLLVSSTLLLAQDRHLGSDSAGALYARSAFAHGYIHGYEAGFHSGDLDLQLGRDSRDPASVPTYKHPCANYRREFGPKPMFRAGFEDGFLAGYSDSYHGHVFRAVASLRKAADGLGVSRPVANFDTGFREGYENGRRQGANDGRSSAASNPVQPPCLGLPDEYCDAFGRGFAIGYDDGYGNQIGSHEPARNLEASAK